jgi:hypothetical protein
MKADDLRGQPIRLFEWKHVTCILCQHRLRVRDNAVHLLDL